MEKGKKHLIILTLFCFSAIIAVTWVIKNSEAQYSNWNTCRDELINKYTFIDKIDIGGRGPGVVIGVQLKKNVDFQEIEKVFNDIINQPQAVFEDIDSLHRKKDGYIEQLYIGFSDNKDTYTDDYMFYSRSKESEKRGFERFEKWAVEHNGVQKIYIPRTE